MTRLHVLSEIAQTGCKSRNYILTMQCFFIIFVMRSNKIVDTWGIFGDIEICRLVRCFLFMDGVLMMYYVYSASVWYS